MECKECGGERFHTKYINNKAEYWQCDNCHELLKKKKSNKKEHKEWHSQETEQG